MICPHKIYLPVLFQSVEGFLGQLFCYQKWVFMQNFLKIQIHLAVKPIGNERVENYQIGVIVWI